MEAQNNNLTSLPEKWCVELLSHYEIINNWGKEYWESKTGWGNLGRYAYMKCCFKEKSCSSSYFIPSEYTLITFEQFERWVLNKKPKYQLWKLKIQS